jgi:hypothetical protein
LKKPAAAEQFASACYQVFNRKSETASLPPSGGRLNQKSSASQRQINCAAKSFAARRGILLRDPNR